MHPLLADCLRLTVGTPEENDALRRRRCAASLDERDMTARNRARADGRAQHQGNADPRRASTSTAAATAKLATGIGFFDHMLDQIARHGLIDLEIEAKGDLHIDGHHTVEDVGITLGQAVAQAVGDKRGLRRYGHAYVPLDEALSRVVIDFSGRPGLEWNVPFKRGMIGDFDAQLAHEFFQGFANHALVTLHIDNLRGDNAHHQCETVFKAFAPRAAHGARTRSARRRRRSVDQGHAVERCDGAYDRKPNDRRRRLRHGQPALGGARR